MSETERRCGTCRHWQHFTRWVWRGGADEVGRCNRLPVPELVISDEGLEFRPPDRPDYKLDTASDQRCQHHDIGTTREKH